jgi:hypothetical protein
MLTRNAVMVADHVEMGGLKGLKSQVVPSFVN